MSDVSVYLRSFLRKIINDRVHIMFQVKDERNVMPEHSMDEG